MKMKTVSILDDKICFLANVFKQGSTKHTYCGWVGGWVGEAVKLYRGGLRDPGAPESYGVMYPLL